MSNAATKKIFTHYCRQCRTHAITEHKRGGRTENVVSSNWVARCDCSVWTINRRNI